ncbi:MAG: prepilin-type N-terminal cleavage/methylation domain-containing protein [Verrucomicrobiae bacterium]|nr:prepilin-type N-terminal cleavage/methylation domain-containing protein [Verrucomicrobiae bacterium]NNJ86241.1 prepilin-type N-terminal cleavage/methylation domain-containing protein [Akkermansiaceae bacterium]
MKINPFPDRRHFRVAPAFTLVEMLVVITIITVMLTVGSLGLRNLSKASGVSAGLPVAEAVFAEARAIAIGKGTRARVLVHATNDRNDELHRERFLRYLAVAYMELDDTGNETGNWIIASRGSKLPENVYFSENLSENNAPNINTMTIELPGRSSTSCYYYEFNAEGLVTDPAVVNNDVPRFVVMAGGLPPGADEPVATGDGKKNMGGFVIWRSGRTSVFRHPDQIEQ